MCFSGPDTPSQKTIAATPTTDNIGESQDVKDAKAKDRNRLRAAAGFQQNILGGTTGVSDGNVNKKQLLGQ